MTILRCAVMVAAHACTVFEGLADPGHEIRIEDLNLQITANPALPDLYYQRAINYREITRLADARADLEKCLTLQPGFLPADRELARLDEIENRRHEGIERLQKALAAAPQESAFHLPGCYAVLADMLLKSDRNGEALAAADKGIALTQEMTIDLYLFRAEAQRRLGKHNDRVRDLAGAVERLKSFVLRIAWIEALIDAGRGVEALPEIQKEIDSSRFKASWLIRRARVRLHGQNTDPAMKEAAVSDLAAALAEVESRIRPERPDLSLVCDRALILALQGNRDEAAKELAAAKARGADQWMTRVLESVLAKK
jgi:tetratricopeptide (TPR) repeat protein